MTGKIKNTMRLNLSIYYYVMLIPGAIYFIVFKYLPMFGLVIAFKNFRAAQGIFGSAWVGLRNFEMLFNASDFSNVILNTIIISLYKLIFTFPAPIILALLLNEVTMNKFKRVVQTIVYLPHFVTWVIISGILVTLLSTTNGILPILGLSKSPMMDPNQFRGLLIITQMWKEAGWGTVVYLAAISGINPELYESAMLDGANRLQKIWHITLPSIRNTIVILLIMRTGFIMNAGFEQVLVLYNPLVYQVSDIIDTYVYRLGIQNGRYSFATAAGLFQSAVGFLMVISTNYVARRVDREASLF